MWKKPLAIGIGIGAFFLCAAAIISGIFWHSTFAKKPTQPVIDTKQPVIDTNLLTHEDEIIGHWKRVGLSEGNSPDGFRQIAASGKMATCYGDIIHDGSFKILDKRTMETAYHYHGEKDEVNLWTFGFMDRKLIMINQRTGWVEAYRRVPPGTLYPSLYP